LLFFTLCDSQISIILFLQIDKMNDAVKHFPENVQKLLSDARIPIEQLKPIYYELTIGEQFPDDSIRLIEINNSLAEELEKSKK
jgi:hypothetical protein